MEPVSRYGEALVSSNEFNTIEKVQLRKGLLFSSTSQSFLTARLANFCTLVFSIQIRGSKHWAVDLSLHQSTSITHLSRITSALNGLLCDWFNLPRKELAVARLAPGLLSSLTVSTQSSPKTTVQVKCLLKDNDLPFKVSSEICQCRPWIRNLRQQYRGLFVYSFSCLLGTWFIFECCNTLPDGLQFTLSIFKSHRMEDAILLSEQFLRIDDGILLRRNKITSLYAFPILSGHTIIDAEQVRDDLYRFYNEKYYYHEELICVKLHFHPDDIEAIQDRVTFFFFEGRPARAIV